jgi:hypothetical protein
MENRKEKKSKLIWIITALWIITLAILIIDVTTQLKPKYYCNEDECNILSGYFMPNCIDSIIIGNSTDGATTFDITNMGDTCHITWLVERDSTGTFNKGDSMTCDVPINVLKQNASAFVNYCTGSMVNKVK